MTNQYGLTVDNVVSYELVLPTGVVTTVDATEAELFFALKVSRQATLSENSLTERGRAVSITLCVFRDVMSTHD